VAHGRRAPAPAPLIAEPPSEATGSIPEVCDDPTPAVASEGPIRRGRLEAISDGVMAVAITLVVLGIDPPTRTDDETLWQALREQTLPNVAMFLLSFFLIARFWMLHHNAFRFLPDPVPLRPVLTNFLFLAVICLMPFTTELFAENLDDLTAFAIYAVGLALASSLIGVLFQQGGLPLTPTRLLVPAVFVGSIAFAALVSIDWAPLLWMAPIFMVRRQRPPTPSP